MFVVWWGLCLLWCALCGVVSDEISGLRSNQICFGSFVFISSVLVSNILASQ